VGHIVSNGKKIGFGPKAYLSRLAPDSTHKGGWAQKLFYAGNKGPRLSVYGDEATKKVEDNLAMVREYFGTNVSDALRISLHLTANAIRNGGLKIQ
jgi:hypothetical protein